MVRKNQFCLQYLKLWHITLTAVLHNLNKQNNARLRGWQRITTKPKHNNRNHRGSLGLETPRVDSPS
ncbi:hypothetical protein B8T99_00090 [Vibrio cholerae]|nr:hypothetical protein [Vibrio cholerae]MRI19998.1 hypothetical protein [Vibrio cholerae]MRI23701.1 hypothetical protein [Vibrio cholerae]MRI27502.1 hypothetical protein [Vibrio cholerae]MRI31200.1 hypothetical protein [Vibrio cholerae]